MNEKDFREIKFLDVEIKRIKEVLKNNQAIKSNLIEVYNEKLQDRVDCLIKRKMEIQDYINSINDTEMRVILSMKYIDLKSWNYISQKLYYDRSTVIKKCKKFMQNQGGYICKKF